MKKQDKSTPTHSEKLLLRAEEMAGVGHWRIDVLNDNQIFWSDEIFRIYGLDKNQGPPSVEDAVKAYHPEDRDFVSHTVENAIANGEDFTFELRIVRPDGGVRHVKTYGECEKNSDGQVVFVFGVFSDITDFKLREIESRKSNDFLNRLIENIPDFVFVKDEDLKIVQANSAFLNMYPAETRDKVIGTTTLEAYSPEQVEEFTKNDREAFADGYSEALETIDFPGGERRTILTKKVGYRDENAKQHLLGISRDVTETMDYQKRLKAILDVNNDGLITINAKGIVESYNKSCERIFGYTEGDVVGQNIKILMPERLAKSHDGYLKAYAETKKPTIIGVGREVVGQHKNGNPIALSLNISEFSVNGLTYFAGVLHDLSETRKIEKALADSEYTREAYADASSDGHWDWFIQNDYEYMSPHFWEMMGYDPKTKQHHPDEWQKIIFPEDLEIALDNFKKHIESKGAHPFTQESRYKHADGSTMWILCKGQVVEWSENGEPIRMIGTHTDITAIKSTEAELIRSNIELERFAYIASHDLQEPLRMVQNFTNLLAQEYGDVLGSDGQKYIHYATDAAGRMRALINDLLEYSRLSHQDSGVQEVDVSHKIEMACMQLSEVIKQRDAQITYDEMPFIRANPLRFSRLMQNLIGNAIKYTDPDKPIHVRIKCEKRDSDYLFSVKDNGIGIKKEYLNKIFVIFERLHGNHDYAGTGIGLAICKKIVDSMGGKIWADSKLGKGSTFYFTVPKTRGERLEND